MYHCIHIKQIIDISNIPNCILQYIFHKGFHTLHFMDISNIPNCILQCFFNFYLLNYFTNPDEIIATKVPCIDTIRQLIVFFYC